MIKNLYAVVSDEPNDGVVGVMIGDKMMPLVISDHESTGGGAMRAVREMAAAISRETNKTLYLKRFELKETHEVFEP